MALQLDSATVQAAQRRLDVLGNNIANVNTVGFKGASFDVMLGSAMGGNGSGVVQNFSQGNITSTNNPLDIAISGLGLFKLQTKLDPDKQDVYTRDGQFSLDKQGHVINSSGYYLLDKNNQPIVIDPLEKDSQKPTENISLGLTLDSRKPDIDTATTTFSISDPTTYTTSTSTSIYDLSGSLKNVQTFYTKTSAGWEVHSAVDGTIVNDTKLLEFDAAGNLNTSVTFDIPANLISNDAAADAQPVTISFDQKNTKQLSTNFEAKMSQDGNPPGQMTGYKVSTDGNITAQYSNGNAVNKGQIYLYAFKNLQGLASAGNNMWKATREAGDITPGEPGKDGYGVLKGSATEDSNIDLTAEMIKLISAQRAFQSAAEVIKKQDEILQGVVHIGQ